MSFYRLDITVPEGQSSHGDNRSNSADSRYHMVRGQLPYVPVSSVVGTVQPSSGRRPTGVRMLAAPKPSGIRPQVLMSTACVTRDVPGALGDRRRHGRGRSRCSPAQSPSVSPSLGGLSPPHHRLQGTSPAPSRRLCRAYSTWVQDCRLIRLASGDRLVGDHCRAAPGWRRALAESRAEACPGGVLLGRLL